MITVRKEWKAIKSDDEMLEWAKKWGGLLMETWNNPIFTAGHTKGKEEITSMLEGIAKGEYPEGKMLPEIEDYADALAMKSRLGVMAFYLLGSPELVETISEDNLKQAAANQMAKELADKIEITKTERNGELCYTFELVMLD